METLGFRAGNTSYPITPKPGTSSYISAMPRQSCTPQLLNFLSVHLGSSAVIFGVSIIGHASMLAEKSSLESKKNVARMCKYSQQSELYSHYRRYYSTAGLFFLQDTH